MKYAISIAALLTLSACNNGMVRRAYYEHTEDAEVFVHVLEKCLSASIGPNTTHYNDQDETVRMCNASASDAARYCPEDARDCGLSYQRSRADVRMVLGAAKGGR